MSDVVEITVEEYTFLQDVIERADSLLTYHKRMKHLSAQSSSERSEAIHGAVVSALSNVMGIEK